MNEQELKVVEKIILKLDETTTDLSYHKIELEVRISELENMRSELLRLLPTDKRVEKLFS